MVQAVKITSLNDIGTSIMYTTLVPVVNMTGTPVTEKANLQIVGNLILTGAGGSYFPPAAQATVSQYVAYAAQPNITSVGTLTSLEVLGNINAGNANLGNLAIANVFSGTLNGSAVSANIANTVAVNAQPNITSLGTLTALNVTGPANLGAVTSLTITGGSPNYVLQTNGTGTLSWVPQTTGSNTGNITFTAANISTNITNRDIQIIGNGTGNVNVVANSQVWTFGADGTTQFPGNVLLVPAGHPLEIKTTDGNVYSTLTTDASGGYASIGLQDNDTGANPAWAYIETDMSNVNTPSAVVILKPGDTGTEVRWTFTADGNLTMPGNIVVDVAGDAIIGSSSNVNVSAGGNTWTFGTDGNLTLPDSGLVWNNGGLTTLQAGSDGAQIGSNDGQSYVIANTNGTYMQTLADTSNYLWHFGTAGNLTLPGILMARASDNGSILFSNNGVDTNGSLKVDAGFNMTLSANSNFYVKQAGNDRLAITNGNTDLMASTNVVIHANKAGTERNWIFGTDSNLTLTNGSTIKDNIGTLSQGPAVDTNNISPVIGTFPSLNFTAPNGVVAGWTVNGPGVTNATVLGIDTNNKFVEIGGGAFQVGQSYTFTGPSAGITGVSITTNSNSWIFGAGGNLQLPDLGLIWDNGGLTTLQAGTDGAQIGSNDGQSYVIANANGTYMQTLADTSDYLWHFGTDGTLNLPQTSSAGNAIIQSTFNIQLNANGNHWTFGIDGNTAFPASGTASLGNLAIANRFSTNGSGGDITLTGGNITGANVVAANTFLGTGNLHLQPDPLNVAAYLNVYLTSGPDIHIAGNGENLILGSDASSNVMLGVDGNVTIQSNTGTPHTWTFGSDGNLTVPSWIDGQVTNFTGAIAGNVLTVTNAVDGTIARGQTLYGTGVAANTVITLQLTESSANAGGNGTYRVTGTQTVTTEQMFVNSLYLDGDLKLAADHGVYVRDAHDPYQYDNLIGISEVDATILIGSLNTNGVTLDNNKEYKVDSALNPGTYMAVAKVDTGDQVVLSSGNSANTLIRVGGDSATTGYAVKFLNGGEGLMPVGLRIGDNTNSSIFAAPLEVGSRLQGAPDNQSSPGGIALPTYRGTGTIIANDEYGSYVYGSRYRGTINSPLPVKNGDWLMEFGATAFDGTNNNGGGEIAFRVAGTVTGSSNPSNIEFYNTATGSNTQSLGMVLDATQSLTVTGNITAGNIVTGSGTSGNITGANVIAANTFQSTVVAFSSLPPATTAGLRAFINNANLVAVGNFGAIVAGGGSNYVPVFSNGANWCIG